MLSPPSTPAWSLNVIHMTTVLTELEETIHILRVQPQRADWLKFDAPEGRKVSSQSQTRKLIHNSKGQSQDGEQWKKTWLYRQKHWILSQCPLITRDANSQNNLIIKPRMLHAHCNIWKKNDCFQSEHTNICQRYGYMLNGVRKYTTKTCHMYKD